MSTNLAYLLALRWMRLKLCYMCRKILTGRYIERLQKWVLQRISRDESRPSNERMWRRISSAFKQRRWLPRVEREKRLGVCFTRISPNNDQNFSFSTTFISTTRSVRISHTNASGNVTRQARLEKGQTKV